MKKFIILSAVLIATQGYSQSFTAPMEVDNETKLVHVFVDSEFNSKATLIEKEYVETSQGTSVLKDNLVLIGDLETSGNNFVLNYQDYIYYLVSFDPEGPILILNNSISSDITQGTLFLDVAAHIGSGDRTYWCDCGGAGAAATDPGGCVSQVSLIWMGPKIVRCVSDGGCTTGCLGTSTPSTLTSGGGLLVQVPKERDLLIHDIRTRK